jgi:hypothetical protein
MPLDNPREPQDSPIMRLLRKGYERLRDPRSWIKGGLVRNNASYPHGFGWCMLGSIQCDDIGVDREPFNPLIAYAVRIMRDGVIDYLRAHPEVKRSIVPSGTRTEDYLLNVPSFNDAPRLDHSTMLECYQHVIDFHAKREMLARTDTATNVA